MGLRRLADLPTWRAGFELMDVLNGKVSVAVLDTLFNGRKVVRISATGITSYGTSFETRTTSTAYVVKGPGPIPVIAAITTNAQTKSAGGLIIDGRDHDLSGGLVANNGILGLYTTNSFTQTGSSAIGGTSGAKVDYAPSKFPDTSIVHSNQKYPGGFPTTPDSVAGGANNGYPEGTLKSFAKSKAGGSQYVTDPSTLKYPLSGITYVELSAGQTWSPKLSGTGVLVVHSASGNAVFKQPSGTFTGLIIGDDVTNLSGLAVLGAIVQISPNPTSVQIGTSNGSITYSRQAMLNATSLLQSGSNGSASNVIAWWE